MYSLGIDIGGTICAVILGKDCLSAKDFIIDKIKFPTEPARGWRRVVDNILQECDRLLQRNSVDKEQLIGVGISCGGPLDSK